MKPNVLIPCGGRWVGLVLQMKQAMRQVPPLREGRLFIADRDALNPAGHFADGTFVVPQIDHPEYSDALRDLCLRHDIGILVPHLDLDLDHLSAFVPRFAELGIQIICPRLELVELCRNKSRFEQFAREEKLAYPVTYRAADLTADLFPLFAKNERGFGSAGAGICGSLLEAQATLAQRPNLIFQELLEGNEVSVDAYLAADGRCTVRVPRLRVRVVGGEVVLSRTIRDESVIALADRTLAALARRGYHGPLNVQIMNGPRPVLVEVNARLGSGVVLSNQATGGRLLRNLLEEACGGVAEGDPDDYRQGLHMTRFWGEMFHDGTQILDVFPPQAAPDGRTASGDHSHSPKSADAACSPRLHPLMEAAFKALNDSGVCWCLLRLPACPAAPQGDIDLLVDRADCQRMATALASVGLVPLPASHSAAGQVFLAYHADSDCWIRFHVVTELCFGPRYGLRTRVESACLARRVRNGVVVELAPEDAFWTTLLHCLLDKGDISLHHRQRLRALAEKTEPQGALHELVELVCPPGWHCERLLASVRHGAWNELLQLPPQLAANWRRRIPWTTCLRDWQHRAMNLPARLFHRWRRRGLSVAMLGPDGAGKSTLAESLACSFFCPARTIYMGFGISGGQNRPTLLARFYLPGLGAPGRLLVLWWRLLIARYHQWRGCLVIFDRYGYDGLAPPPGRRPLLRRLSSWVKARVCPAPDVALLLDAPGTVMHERKGDLDPNTLEFQRQRYLALHKQLPCLQVLDATRPPSAVRIDATLRLWRLYAQRYQVRRLQSGQA